MMQESSPLLAGRHPHLVANLCCHGRQWRERRGALLLRAGSGMGVDTPGGSLEISGGLSHRGPSGLVDIATKPGPTSGDIDILTSEALKSSGAVTVQTGAARAASGDLQLEIGETGVATHAGSVRIEAGSEADSPGGAQHEGGRITLHAAEADLGGAVRLAAGSGKTAGGSLKLQSGVNTLGASGGLSLSSETGKSSGRIGLATGDAALGGPDDVKVSGVLRLGVGKSSQEQAGNIDVFVGVGDNEAGGNLQLLAGSTNGLVAAGGKMTVSSGTGGLGGLLD